MPKRLPNTPGLVIVNSPPPLSQRCDLESGFVALEQSTYLIICE